MSSIHRSTLLALLAGLLIAAGPQRASQPAHVFRDAFIDGSGRSGPAMVQMNGGSFVMGAHPGDPEYRTDSLPHVVQLSPFGLAQFSVTGAQFAAFLRDRPRSAAELATLQSGTTSARGWQAQPATNVTWRGAIEYAQWLTRKTGHVYTLPSEAQWEYAARAGSQSAWPWGSTWQSGRINCDHEHASPLPQASLRANRFGIAGMPGNVWEWTIDCLDLGFYMHSPSRDPVSLNPSCSTPVIRGGSFADPPAYCSPGYRVNYFAQGSPEIGFRVVRRVVSNVTSGPPATITRAPLTFGDGRGGTLEISVSGARTDLPLALMIGVTKAQAAGADARASGDAGAFLEQQKELPLALGGVTRITGLPAMQLGVYVVSPDVTINAKRTVTIPGNGVARLRFTVEQLIGARERVPLHGILKVRRGGAPLAHATLVYGCYPDRVQTQTDAQGRFTITRADANRNGSLFIDAPNRMPLPFDRTTAITPVTASTVREYAHGVWEIDLDDVEKGAGE